MKKIIIILTIFIFDRVTKMYFIHLQESGTNVDYYIFSFLNFEFHMNSGIGFGLLQTEPNTFLYHFITSIIVLLNLLIFFLIFGKIGKMDLSKKILDILGLPENWGNRVYTYMFAVILGGSLGNLFDRIAYYSVPDFIDFHFGNFHWPAFNVADIFISLGIIIILLIELFKKKTKNV